MATIPLSNGKTRKVPRVTALVPPNVTNMPKGQGAGNVHLVPAPKPSAPKPK
jgi:hypothetical protein